MTYNYALQILIEGWNSNAVDIDGNPLPTLVYVSRQKKPQYAHNFKAGALNALVIFYLQNKFCSFHKFNIKWP